MKKTIKKIINFIIETKIFNPVIGQIKLKTLKNLEKRKIPFIRKMLEIYYNSYLDKKSIKCNENKKQKSKVYFITNIFPLWKKSTSNFLKVNADIAAVYLKNNVEVEFIIMNHSHISYLPNKGLKWNDLMEVDYFLIEKKIKNDIFNMCGVNPNRINIQVINKKKGNIRLKDYLNDVVNFFNNLNISINDIFIYSGGVCKSDLGEIILEKLCAKKIYLTMGTKEFVNCKKYDYVLSCNKNLIENYKNVYFSKNVNFSPFFWEKHAKLNSNLKNIINELLNKKVEGIFVSSKQNFAKSIDNEFIEILNYIMLNYKNFYLILVGDSKENILKKLKNKIMFDSKRIICIEFIDSLYVFFRELSKNFKTLYILPRITGSGITSLMAACANIPTVIFEGNDAENTWIPGKYFVATKEEYIDLIKEFLENENKVNKFIQDFNKFKSKEKIINERFYLDLLNQK